MLLSTNTANVLMHYGAKEMVDMLQKAGFDAIDFSFFDKVWYSEDRQDTFFSELRKYAEGMGMCFNQAHAPFHSSFPDEEQTKTRFQEIVCALRRAALLGASGIVYMLILLSSLASMRQNCIPLTLILVAAIYLGGEVVNGLTASDNISQLSHIVGGVCGAIFGMALNNGNRRR